MSNATPYDTHGPIGEVAHVVVRVVKGASHRFAVRLSDWFASTVLVSFGFVLLNWPDAFKSYPFYAMLGQFAGPFAWGYLIAAIGGFRLFALFINGTFRSFRWSPHMRCAMAILSCFIWFQIDMGLILAHVPTTAFAIYPQLLLLDFINVYFSATEAGMVERRLRNVE